MRQQRMQTEEPPPMSPQHPLEAKLAAAWPPGSWADVTVLLAVSGGCDSVAMLRAMTAIRLEGVGRVCVAHVNHQLRAEADVDEAFVADLCGALGVDCEIGRVSIDRTSGIEAAARSARYRFLKEVAGRVGARYIVTAHTADDQVETIVHRIFRGTGIAGLSGMRRARPLGHATLIRPLLGVRRAELAAYLSGLGQSFREDKSNADLRFTRNRIRHDLLPWAKRHVGPSTHEAILRLGQLAGEVQTVVDQLVADLLDRCAQSENSDAVQIDAVALADQPRYVVRELLMAVWRRQGWPMQAMGFAQWEQLSDMAVRSNCERKMLPGNVLAEVADGWLRLTGG